MYLSTSPWLVVVFLSVVLASTTVRATGNDDRDEDRILFRSDEDETAFGKNFFSNDKAFGDGDYSDAYDRWQRIDLPTRFIRAPAPDESPVASDPATGTSIKKQLDDLAAKLSNDPDPESVLLGMLPTTTTPKPSKPSQAALVGVMSAAKAATNTDKLIDQQRIIKEDVEKRFERLITAMNALNQNLSDDVKQVRDNVSLATQKVIGAAECCRRNEESFAELTKRHDSLGEKLAALNDKLASSLNAMHDKIVASIEGRFADLAKKFSSIETGLKSSSLFSHDGGTTGSTEQPFARRSTSIFDMFDTNSLRASQNKLQNLVPGVAKTEGLECRSQNPTRDQMVAADKQLMRDVAVEVQVPDEGDPTTYRMVNLTVPVLASKLDEMVRGRRRRRGMVSICYHNQPKSFIEQHPGAEDDPERVRVLFNGTMDAANDPKNGVDLTTPKYVNAMLLELKSMKRSYVSVCVEDATSNSKFRNDAECMNLLVRGKSDREKKGETGRRRRR